MNQEAAKLRVEQLKQWVESNREYLEVALITSKAEITISMKGASIKAKVTQFPDEI
ncbi:MAG: hypothetical protein HY865_22560 [Chloroflexi bacterium]|nr:hypothetical protein [Chloroflexota bacterium]